MGLLRGNEATPMMTLMRIRRFRPQADHGSYNLLNTKPRIYPILVQQIGPGTRRGLYRLYDNP
jgi:hypothetical protein